MKGLGKGQARRCGGASVGAPSAENRKVLRSTLSVSSSSSSSSLRRRERRLQLGREAGRNAGGRVSVGSSRIVVESRRQGGLKVRAAAEVSADGNGSAISEPELTPVKVVPFVVSVALGVIINFLVPRPDGITKEAWQLLSIFVSTVAGLVIGPLPVGAWAFAGVTTAIATKTLTFKAAFSSFSLDVIWLVVNAFFLAKGFVKSGLGDRVATYFVKLFGKSSLGLSYGLTVSEGILSPSMPSSTARCGGIYLPIIVSLAKQAGSLPGKTANKLGAFLAQAQLQTTAHLSSISLTGAAQNTLGLVLAANLGYAVSNPWITWFKAGIVPGLAGLFLTPLIVYKIMPPEIKETPDAPKAAAQKLKELGPMKKIEWMVAGTMMLTMVLWIFGDKLGIAGATAAMVGITLQMIGGVLTWDDLLKEKGAWDTLIWFAVLVAMSAQLKEFGLIGALSAKVNAGLTAMNLGWPAVFITLHVAYFLLHYLFASQTAQLAALGSAFLATMIGAGTPPLLAALTIPFHTNLFGGMTHYASGQSAVFYGSGYYDMPTTFKVGGIVGITNLLIWGIVGGVWWKIIGLY
ncbi:sodium/sulfate symporter [Chloropicon primus]|uniref:Sodium/sulfate symporter n=1 Tax=Chloropicon primus TaxID=1764295 RepID=A0A5B8MJK6_9CHLO|nr:sodium/sulfate symporter [Chloropicon primus]UPQ99076.1 sodium/sulfate symporter [Chloropicon primus]|eukprot:QDZ19865.1 sodium/sulfate symporter [Chloropicon primus]